MKKIEKKISVRDKILNTAVELFYSRGVNKVGIDEIIERSGVAKMSLYNHFKSKDELVIAFLECINAQWLPMMRQKVEQLASKPENRLAALFDALEEWFKSKEFRGCPYINTTAEIADINHPVAKKCLSFKQCLFDYVEELVKQAGVSKSKDITSQIVLIIDGSIVRTLMTKNADHAKLAKKACFILIDQAKLRGFCKD